MSTYQPSVLKQLPADKTVVFYSPVEGNDVLVRTGIIDSESSFVHALLHAHSDEYVRSEPEDRITLVNKLYSKLNSKIDQKRWQDMSNSLVAQIPFQENVSLLLTDFYKSVTKDKNPKLSKSIYTVLIAREKEVEKSAFQIICELIPFERAKAVLADCFTRFGDEKIDTCKQIVIDKFKELAVKEFEKLTDLTPQLRKSCIERFVKLGEKIVEEADMQSYQDYLSKMKTTNVIVDGFTVSLLSERLNRDIYFFDSKTHLPYRMDGSIEMKNRKAILVMWMGDNRYEVIGKLLQQNRIQREFYPNDPLIKRIHTFVYHPENVADIYPNLIPYLSEEERNKIGFFNGSVSKSDHESDTESESETDSIKKSSSKHRPSHRRKRSRK